MEEEDLMEEEDPDEGAGGAPQKREARQLPVAPYMPTSEQQQDYHKELMRCVIDAEIPFKKMNNPILRSDGVQLKMAALG